MTRPKVAAPSAPTRTAPFTSALVLTSISTFVAMVAYSAPLGNAPTLARALAASPAATTWILSSMSAGLAVSLLTAGALADQTGRRRVFTGGCGVFTAGSVLCAVASGPTLFVAGRLVEGVGAAGVIATGLGLVAAVGTSAEHRASSAAWWGASMGVGIAGGPVLSGLFDLASFWPATYWLLTAAGAGIALAARWCFVETAADPDRRLDPLGAALMTVGLAALLVALVQARQGGGAAAVGCGVVAVLVLAGFVVSQRRGRSPMVRPELLRRRDFVGAIVAAASTGAGVIALMSCTSSILGPALRLTSMQAAGVLCLWSATSAVSAVLCRRFVARLRGPVHLAVGLAATGVGLLLLTGLSQGATPWRLAPGLLVAGIASGVLNSGLGRQAVATVPAEHAALGVGVNNTARYVAASVGVTVVTMIAASTDRFTGWTEVTVLTGVVSLLGAVAVVLLRPARHPG